MGKNRFFLHLTDEESKATEDEEDNSLSDDFDDYLSANSLDTNDDPRPDLMDATVDETQQMTEQFYAATNLIEAQIVWDFFNKKYKNFAEGAYCFCLNGNPNKPEEKKLIFDTPIEKALRHKKYDLVAFYQSKKVNLFITDMHLLEKYEIPEKIILDLLTTDYNNRSTQAKKEAFIEICLDSMNHTCIKWAESISANHKQFYDLIFNKQLHLEDFTIFKNLSLSATTFSEKRWAEIINQLLANYAPQYVEMLRTHLHLKLTTDQQKILKKQMAIFTDVPCEKKDEKELNPTFTLRQAIAELTPQTLNPAHALLYKSDPEKQKNYTFFYRNTAQLAVWWIQHNLKSAADVVKLLETIAWHRGQHACQVNQAKKSDFGKRRSADLSTPTRGPYAAFQLPADAKDLQLTTDKFGDQTPYNCTIHSQYGWVTSTPPLNAIENFAKEFFMVCTATFANTKETQQALARLHWLGVNIAPWSRGSASIIEIAIDAAHIALLGRAPKKIPGFSFDCIALSMPLEQYVKEYPFFYEYLAKHRSPAVSVSPSRPSL